VHVGDETAAGASEPALTPDQELAKLIADQKADMESGDVGLIDVELGAENVLDLPETQSGVATASEIFEALPDIENRKNIASGVEGKARKSGWAGENMAGAEQAMVEGLEAAVAAEPHFRDPKDFPGLYKSSHSEPTRAAGTSDQHFASSKHLCPGCQQWFSGRAKVEGRHSSSPTLAASTCSFPTGATCSSRTPPAPSRRRGGDRPLGAGSAPVRVAFDNRTCARVITSDSADPAEVTGLRGRDCHLHVASVAPPNPGLLAERLHRLNWRWTLGRSSRT
jgi:hypothetical protein